MKIKKGQVTLDEPTTEINIYIDISSESSRRKAKILETKQDSLGRTYITVY